MQLTFLGAVGTVTGSKYLVSAGGKRILVDCGLFQGLKALRLRNWARFPADPAGIDAVVLTHAHLDHTGYLPLLVRNGFSGPVFCTEATKDLCSILLTDSGHLMERDAEFANRHGFSKHHPALPLYTERDAEACLDRLSPIPFDKDCPLGNGLRLRFLPAGHILGAAMIRLACEGVSVLFSGDLGRPHSPTMVPPAIVRHADYLIVESTYGSRHHDSRPPGKLIADIVRRTAARGGIILIPAFAVGRTQELLWHLAQLKAAREIPDIPVFLDSPMAIDASTLFCKHRADHRLTEAECRAACGVARYVQTIEESKALDANHVPKIIVSASGMATGGRVLHHLKLVAPDARNTIVLTGFQAAGTRGAAMAAGAESLKIHGAHVPLRAEIVSLDMLSAHADAEEIMTWLSGFEAAPRMTFVTHGEPAAAEALAKRIESELRWAVRVPTYEQTEELK